MYKVKKRSKKTILLVVSLLVLTAAILATIFIRTTYQNNLKPVSADTQSVIITVAPGSSVAAVARVLEQRGLIRSANAFEWYVRTRNVRDKLQAGSYAITPADGIEKIVALIINGKVATDLFTILPAQRLDQIQASFVASFAQFGVGKDVVNKAFDPAQYATHPALTDKPAGASLEGYLYPESFQRTATTSPQVIINSSLDQMALALTPDVRAGIAKQGLTVHEGVIIASIVEKEVTNETDKKKAAQVFLKRYRQSMQLGSDVTAYYGAEVAGLERSVFTDTPYNTRLYKGLPPGPISNVTSSSLNAVANPATTDYLYFVSGDDGVTYFSNTLKEHEAATAQHCKKLCLE